MESKFDPLKSAANLEKHGIDFQEAQQLWLDSARLEIPARTVGEPRWLMIAMLDGKHWSAVITYQQERTRIISVRRSREEEVALYEG